MKWHLLTDHCKYLMRCRLRGENSVLAKPVERVHQAAHSTVLAVQRDKRTKTRESALTVTETICPALYVYSE